jgi:hypothetical protein
MNLDELKPIWKAYKEDIEKQSHWNETELLDLLKEKPKSYPWHKQSRLTVLNLCMSLLLMGITGC